MPDLKSFLNKIAQIESAGGRNTNHPVMNRGMHKGMSAIGNYGLMPLTVRDIAGQSSDPEIAELSKYDPVLLKQVIESNPGLENKIAASLADKVLSKQGGDELKAAYAWNQGHNLNPEQINPGKLALSPYAQKFAKLSQMMIPTNPNEQAKTISNASLPTSPIDFSMADEPVEELRKEPFSDEEEDPRLEALKQLLR